MSQTWDNINTGAAGDTVEDGINRIISRLDSLRSTWSGATKPAGGVLGQLHIDTDDTFVYFLKSTGPDVWEKFLTGNATVAEGGTGATTAGDARDNLGLGTAATVNTGTEPGEVPLTSEADSRYLQRANNLSDVVSPASAIVNLGLGDLATLDTVTAAQIDASAVTTAKINAGAVTNDKIGNNIIAIGKLANFTALSVVASDAAGSPTSVTIASLVGSRTLLASQIVTSSVGYVDFISGLTATYDRYEIQIDKLVPVNDGVSLLLQVSTNGGTAWLNTLYSWVIQTGMVQYAPAQAAAAASTTSISINMSTDANRRLGNAAGRSSNWNITVYSPSSATLQKMFSWEGVQHSSTAYWGRTEGMGNHTGTAAINAIRLVMSGGNIASGTFGLYGIK